MHQHYLQPHVTTFNC